MRFDLEKYQMMTFIGQRAPSTAAIHVGRVTIRPIKEVRMLGVWLDRRLNWSRHRVKVKEKMMSQMLSLRLLVRSTWGLTMIHSRTMYTAIIRAAAGFGAPVWHQVDVEEGKIKGIAVDMQK